MPDQVELFVPGIPATAGSRSAFKTKDGRVIMAPASKKTKAWIDSVRWFAMKAFDHQIPWIGPVFLQAIFIMPPPKAHYGTGRNAGKLKPSAPNVHYGRPDLDKLVRAIGDALTGIIYKDDAQISDLDSHKIYGETTGVYVWLNKLDIKRIYDIPTLISRQIGRSGCSTKEQVTKELANSVSAPAPLMNEIEGQ